MRTPKISLLWEDTLGAIAFLAFVLVASTGVLSLERQQPLPPLTAQGERDELSGIAGRSAVLLTHPIDYRISVCQSDYGEQPTCRYYTERSQ